LKEEELMRLRRLPFILPLLFLSTSARAHDHDAYHAFGGSYEDGSTLLGIFYAYEHNVQHADGGNPDKWRPLTLAAETNLVFGSDKTRFKIVGGPRFSWGRKSYALYGHVLGGIYYSSLEEERPPNPFTWKVGVGIDIAIADDHGYKVQADYVFPPGQDRDPYVQINVGFVWRKLPPTP
jgi:hypothetical protein